MYCKTCGKELNDQAVFCPGCGCEVSPIEKNMVVETKRNGKEIHFNILAMLFAIISSFSLLIYPIDYTLICSFVLSMIFVSLSILFAVLGLVFAKGSVYKIYGIMAIVIAVCSYICVFINFGMFMF